MSSTPGPTPLRTLRNQAFSTENRKHSPLYAIAAYTEEIDRALELLFRDMVPEKAPVSLIALGGYGRRELFPHSDVDLLLLHRFKKAPDYLQGLIRKFWDTGLTIGCVMRTPQECARILGQDIATDTAFLESRLITGSNSPYEELQRSVVAPHFKRHGGEYAREIKDILSSTLFDATATVYHTEPDLKNGPCCLRDCQRLIWAEKARNRIATIKQIPVLSTLRPHQGNSFVTAYEFMVSLRVEVHLLCDGRMDVLETALQPDVARAMGYGDNGAGTLMEGFFRSVRDVRATLLTYLEQENAGRGPVKAILNRLRTRHIAPGIALRNDTMVPGSDITPEIGSPQWVIGVFSTALELGCAIGIDLLNRISVFTQALTPASFRTAEISTIIMEMLASKKKSGHLFVLMHESGVLAKLLPPFEPLTCKVEYDSYHEYTVDRHILLMLDSLDALDSEESETIREAWNTVERRDILRLGILLHDVGKSMEGDHVHNSAVMADTLCERFGLNDEEMDRIRFLIYNHLELHNLSVLRDPEDTELRVFAAAAGDVQNLNMLYVLTVLDIRCVGSKTWSAWKGHVLAQIYTRLKQLLTPSAGEPAPLEVPTDPLALYQHDILPEDKELHRRLLTELDSSDLKLELEDLTGFQRLIVCGVDRVGFLSDIIGCISSEGFNILSARVFTTPEGKVLDMFNLEPPQLPRLTSQEHVQNIYHKWEKMKSGSATSDSLVSARLRNYPPSILRTAVANRQVTISIDNATSRKYTLVEVDTPDNFGLLHTIVKCMSKHGVNIVSARLSTRIDLAVDVFYVTDAAGNKITDEITLAQLSEDLKNSLSK